MIIGTIGILLLVTGIILLVSGFVFAAVKSLRPRTGMMIFPALLCVVLAFICMSIGFSDESQSELSANGTSANNLMGFPNVDTLEKARELGINRHEAFVLLSDSTAIRRYCDDKRRWIWQEKRISEALNNGGDPDELFAQSNALQNQIEAEFNERFGLQEFEMATLALEGHWDAHCRALELNWPTFDHEDTVGIDRKEARKASDAIAIAFIDQKDNGSPSPYINQWNGRGAVTCSPKRIDRVWYVGCQWVSFSGKSPNFIFKLGQETDSSPILIYPLTGKSMQLWESAIERLVVQYRDFASAYWTDEVISAGDIGDIIDRFE